MLVQQRKGTFIRSYNEFGYIYSRNTKADRVYDGVGAQFLAELSREAEPRDAVLERLQARFPDVPNALIAARFDDMINDLATQHFVLLGEDEAELEQRERELRAIPSKSLSAQIRARDDPAHGDYTNFVYEAFKNQAIVFRGYMDLTLACNVKCTHCYLPKIRDAKEIDVDMAKRVIDEMREMGTLFMTFSGGEIFLHRQIGEVLRHARKRDMAMTLLTNGTRLTEDHLDLIEELEVETVQMTLFSLDGDIHDAITQKPGSHKNTMHSIHRLLDRGVPIKLACPILKLNRKAAFEVSAWCYERDIPVSLDMGIFACVDGDQSPINTRLSLGEAEALISEMIERDAGYRECLELRDPQRKPDGFWDDPTCGAANDTILCTSNGDYHFCTLFRTSLGNAYEDSLDEVWNHSQQMLELRGTTWKAFPECMDCEAFRFCSMCFAKNYTNSGDHLEIDRHCCDVAFLNKRLVEQYWRKVDGLPEVETTPADYPPHRRDALASNTPSPERAVKLKLPVLGQTQ